ncbi:unnamed protein product [Cuscuta campestris]|uniref:Retrotransposon Copia-like N-terminal domain-containing protein n=1 Tax=Cuscuta campestris TaxID=132261 RepID=A0A484N9R8_9ASTE|nr:unnamed protein product [Cuscuta campestris]
MRGYSMKLLKHLPLSFSSGDRYEDHDDKTALSANLLLGWIDGHEAAPAPTISKNDKTVPNPEYTSWTIVDTQIRACLLAVISPSVHKHARGFTTSAALWDALAARCFSSIRLCSPDYLLGRSSCHSKLSYQPYAHQNSLQQISL